MSESGDGVALPLTVGVVGLTLEGGGGAGGLLIRSIFWSQNLSSVLFAN